MGNDSGYFLFCAFGLVGRVVSEKDSTHPPSPEALSEEIATIGVVLTKPHSLQCWKARGADNQECNQNQVHLQSQHEQIEIQTAVSDFRTFKKNVLLANSIANILSPIVFCFLSL